MEIKIISILNLVCYSIIADHSFAYIISLTIKQKNMSSQEFMFFRKVMVKKFHSDYGKVVCVFLLFSLTVTILLSVSISSLIAVTSAISLIALLIDIGLTIRANLHLDRMNSLYSLGRYFHTRQENGTEEFNTLKLQQWVILIGFVCQLVAVVF